MCYNACMKAFFFGFSRWKRSYIRPFFDDNTELIHCKNLASGVNKGLSVYTPIYIWGKKPFPEVEQYAKTHNIPLYRVEDGFVRSVSLGSDLTRPYSLVIDSRGIYFDPSQPSDLEYILNIHTFDTALLERARKLQEYLIAHKISKYNVHQEQKLTLPGHKEGQKVVMVPGQVEDDASIIYGAEGMTNLELLKQSRENAPDAYIIYKPHPDVLAGNRKGHIVDNTALCYCNTIITDASLDSVLAVADEVHTMTSLVGFEALIRGKKVYTYGMPFYAGWGLTIDAKKCTRRRRNLSLHELIAAAYILYPRYIDPISHTPCEAEVCIANIELMKKRYNNDIFFKTATDIRNWLSRKMQLLLKVMLGE